MVVNLERSLARAIYIYIYIYTRGTEEIRMNNDGDVNWFSRFEFSLECFQVLILVFLPYD